MTIRTKTDYSGLYLTPTGIWPDNNTGDISPLDLRTGIKDLLETIYKMPSGIYGDLVNGNYTEFENNTGFSRSYGSGCGWDDIRFPLIGRNIDISAGRIDYNYSENSVDFATNADSTDIVCMIIQMQHDYKSASNIEPHLHWIQEESGYPAWRLNYRYYGNGQQVPIWETGVMPTQHLYPYTTGNILQITTFPTISGSLLSGIGVSWFLDVQLYRDGGVDAYSKVSQSKEFDIHYIRNDNGSGREFIK